MQHNKPGKLLLAVRFMLTIVLFTLCNISHAQENSPVKKDSIKKVQSASDSFNVNSLTPRGWVNDYEAIFSKEEVAVMDSLISEFEKKTTIEITIVTVKKEWVTAEHFDDLVNSIAQNWGIGKAGKDNGIVIGLSKSVRRIRITTGPGVQLKLPDDEVKWIIDNEMIPEFKNGNFYEGARKGLEKIMHSFY